jgi:WYL domain
VRPAGFNATEYMAATFGTIRGDGDYWVVLRFTPAYAGRIAEKQWHSSQVAKPQPDGSLILRPHVNDLREIERCEKWCQVKNGPGRAEGYPPALPQIRNFRGGRGNPKLDRARRAPLPYSAVQLMHRKLN